MTRKALRIGIVVGLLVALLLGAGAYVYFVGTRTLLEHAEALSFSRMQAARLADGDTLRLFYASNRVAEPRSRAGKAPLMPASPRNGNRS
jgi:endonuclease YncB( thermonuclease family)